MREGSTTAENSSVLLFSRRDSNVSLRLVSVTALKNEPSYEYKSIPCWGSDSSHECAMHIIYQLERVVELAFKDDVRARLDIGRDCVHEKGVDPAVAQALEVVLHLDVKVGGGSVVDEEDDARQKRSLPDIVNFLVICYRVCDGFHSDSMTRLLFNHCHEMSVSVVEGWAGLRLSVMIKSTLSPLSLPLGWRTQDTLCRSR